MAAVSDSTQCRQKEKNAVIGVDYEAVKHQYLVQVENYYSYRKLCSNYPFTLEIVNRIKSLIKEGLALEAAGYPSSHPKYKVINKYEVICSNKDKAEILILKRKEKGDPMIQVLPAEDCFEIIMGAHKQTNHGGKQVILNLLRHKYSVPKTSIDFVLSVCRKCNPDLPSAPRRFPEKNLRIFFHSAQVCIIDMIRPDNKFRHILCLEDKLTKYLILRPLMTSSVDEIAIELLKIFLDFGPPDTLESNNVELFKKTMNLITAACDFDIPVVFPVKAAEIGPSDVICMLEQWQSNTKSSNWAMGCHILQWKMNSNNVSTGNSPYEAVFGMEPGISRKNDDDDCESQGQVLLYKDDSGIKTFNTPPVRAPETDVHMVDCEDLRDLIRVKEALGSDNQPKPELPKASGIAQVTINDDVEVISDSEDIVVNSAEAKKEDNKNKTDSAPVISLSKQDAGKLASHFVSHINNVPVFLRKSMCVPVKSTNVGKTPVDGAGIIVKCISQNNTKPAKPADDTCPVCRTSIRSTKVYTCVECDRNVHLFCSDRLLEPQVSPDVLSVTCTNCKFRKRNIEKKPNDKQF